MKPRSRKRTRDQLRADVRQWLADYVDQELSDEQIDQLLDVVRSDFTARPILGEVRQ